MPVPPFPPSLHVFVRDWLSANNVLLKSRDGHVLIDTGHTRHAPLTLALLAGERGLRSAPLAKIVNTHCHSDHVGGNAALVRRYACSVAVPETEAPLVARWDGAKLLYDYCDQRIDRFEADHGVPAGSTHVWGDLEWRALAAPGHDMGALVFYNPEHRLLISGDALWERGFGFVMPREIDPEALPATRATLDMIADLDVRVVIPGHGDPFTGVAEALDEAMRRLRALESDSVRVARHALKVNLMFNLLDQQRMPLAEMGAYVERVPMYREFNARFFRLPPADFALLLIGELEKSGAARCAGDWLEPSG